MTILLHRYLLVSAHQSRPCGYFGLGLRASLAGFPSRGTEASIEGYVFSNVSRGPRGSRQSIPTT